MLRKLLKYELKATARLFIPFYIALIVCALLNRAFFMLDAQNTFINVLRNLFGFAFVCIVIVIGVMAFITMITRFYKNMLGDEGYLMNTLPVKMWAHIMNKLIVSILWIISGIIVIAAAMAAAFGTGELLRRMMDGLSLGIDYLHDTIGLPPAVFITQGVLLLLLYVTTIVLMIYASISLGHLIGKHRIVGAIGAYIALNTVTQIIISIIVAIFLPLAITNSISLSHSQIWNLIFWGGSLYYLAMCTALFCLTSTVLTKKLNLE